MAAIQTVEQLRERIAPPAPLTAAKILPYLDAQARAFVAEAPFLVLATAGPTGLELSPKGDAAGFIAIADDKTLLIPERRGNQMALGLLKLLSDDRVGAIIFRPNSAELLRITGRAELRDDPELCARLATRGAPAVLVIRIAVERAYFHCARSTTRAGLWKPETWLGRTSVSFGRIYADALRDRSLEQGIDARTADHNSDL